MPEGAVVVTGSSGGLGSAICAVLKDAGYVVVGIDKHESGETNASTFIRFDICEVIHRPESADRLRQLVLDNCVESQIVGLVNNAAIQLLGATGELSLDEWSRTLEINLTVPFLMSKLFLKELTSCNGSIVNIGSVHGQSTKPGFVGYATSKAGLEGLTRAMAVDLGGSVRVNAIRPAAIATTMLEEGFDGSPQSRAELDSFHPVGRIGQPLEVGKLVSFLISDSAAFMTGAVVDIDGGVLSRLHDPL